MTHQASDRLINDFDSLDIQGLHLYNVSFDLPEPPNVDENYSCSALWRGYIATFRINQSGTFELLQFEIPHFSGEPTIQKIESGLYWGDFEITLRPFFTGPNTTIPFRSGVVVPEKHNWKIEQREICGWNLQLADRHEYSIETDAGKGIIPASLVSDSYAPELLDGHSGTINCLIHDFDSNRNCFIFELTKLNQT
jgi:hypothetical protein